jgi:hypothetical protein
MVGDDPSESVPVDLHRISAAHPDRRRPQEVIGADRISTLGDHGESSRAPGIGSAAQVDRDRRSADRGRGGESTSNTYVATQHDVRLGSKINHDRHDNSDRCHPPHQDRRDDDMRDAPDDRPPSDRAPRDPAPPNYERAPEPSEAPPPPATPPSTPPPQPPPPPPRTRTERRGPDAGTVKPPRRGCSTARSALDVARVSTGSIDVAQPPWPQSNKCASLLSYGRFPRPGPIERPATSGYAKDCGEGLKGGVHAMVGRANPSARAAAGSPGMGRPRPALR